MKKLLVLALVVSLTGLASAGLMLSATEVDTGVFTVKLVQDAPNETGSGGEIQINVVGDALIGDVDYLPKATFDAGTGTFFGWDWSLVSGFENVDGVKLNAVPNLGAGTPGVGSIVDQIKSTEYDNTIAFTLTVQAPTTVSISGQWDGEMYDGASAMELVPEPMTVALLGLGGLFLRRRK